MLRMFSRFVTVGLGMFARFCMLFSNLHGTTLVLRFGMCFISTEFKQTKQTAVDVKHGSLVEHCS